MICQKRKQSQRLDVRPLNKPRSFPFMGGLIQDLVDSTSSFFQCKLPPKARLHLLVNLLVYVFKNLLFLVLNEIVVAMT